MSAVYALSIASAVMLVLAVVQIPVRMGWANQSSRPVGGAWWVIALVTVGLSWMAFSAGSKGQAKSMTAAALAELKVVTAAAILKEPDAWENVPVVVHDIGICQGNLPGQGAQGALATRVKVSGEDEAEGEENDYMTTVDYGIEQDVVKFSLGSDPASKLHANDEGWTVLPAASPVRKEIDTGEYAAAKGGNLMDFEDRANIPCGAVVSVAGVITKQGEFIVLEPMAPALSIITDRPWTQVVEEAATKSKGAVRGFWAWFFLAGLAFMVQSLMTLMARRKA